MISQRIKLSLPQAGLVPEGLLLQSKSVGRAGEMAWLVKYVPCKDDDLTSVLRIYVKKYTAAGTGHRHTQGTHS